MLKKIDGWVDAAAVWLLRGAAMGLGTLGAIILALIGYIALSVAPELIVAVVIASAMMTASLYLWKRAARIAAAAKHLIL